MALGDVGKAPLNPMALKAQGAVSGGGAVLCDLSYNIQWTTRFIVISSGRDPSFALDGYFDISMPSNGVTITGVGGAANQTVASGKIPLGQWVALYYILPLGQTFTSLPANFRLVHYSADVFVPSHWVRIAARNGDAPEVVSWANGVKTMAGQSFTASGGNASAKIRRDVNNLLTITSGVGVYVTFDTADHDDGNFWNSSQPTRLTLQQAGVYRATARCQFSGDPAGYREVFINLNRTTPIGYMQFLPTVAVNNAPHLLVEGYYPCAAGDYLEVQVAQNSGNNLDVNIGDNNFHTGFWVEKIS